MQKKGISQKLIRAFVLQMLFISVVTVTGVFAAAIIVEQVMIRTALEDEAKHFWREQAANPEHAVPNTDNLRGYLAVSSDYRGVPQVLRSVDPGFQRVDMEQRKPIVYVEKNKNQRLFLVFDERNVRSLSFYFGVVPLSLALIVIYLSAWFVYRSSRKTLSPLMSLAQTMRGFDLSKDKLDSLHLEDYTQSGVDDEVSVLADSLDEFTQRLKRQLQREREFTHDVSHELRTPLAVIRGSLELLNKQPDLNPPSRRAIRRMRTTSDDMLSIIETLLVLARDSESPDVPQEITQVNQLVPTIISQIESTHNADKHVFISLKSTNYLEVKAPTQAVAIVLSNLLRNACNYTHEGTVEVTITDNHVSINDSGKGIPEDQLERIQQPFQRSSQLVSGYGLGLDIVRRLCERFKWRLDIQSELGKGTVVTVWFK
ncbi:sensor histidine kinase [Leucothrix pacifica]|uniref:sensor histidine kinase n=1 Tax=Leucothrix pacifica TaxID=1247513 RepID=UPI0015E85626|nr:HAMP domain-containing sensor histidine kinase [Leucothrix pacifica]